MRLAEVGGQLLLPVHVAAGQAVVSAAGQELQFVGECRSGRQIAEVAVQDVEPVANPVLDGKEVDGLDHVGVLDLTRGKQGRQ